MSSPLLKIVFTLLACLALFLGILPAGAQDCFDYETQTQSTPLYWTWLYDFNPDAYEYIFQWDLAGDILFFETYLWYTQFPDLGGSTINIWDISDPESPVLLDYSLRWSQKENLGLLAYGDYLYTGDGVYNWLTEERIGSFYCLKGDVLVGDCLYRPAYTGITIFDLSDPAVPIQVGSLFGKDQSDELILVQNGMAYTRTLNKNKLSLVAIDVTDPHDPEPLGYLTQCGELLDLAGSIIYLEDDTEIQLVDVTDPTAMVQVGSFPRPENLNSLSARGDMFYLLSNYNLLQIGDASDPTSPILGQAFLLSTYIDGSTTSTRLHGQALLTKSSNRISSLKLDCSDPAFDPSPVIDPPAGRLHPAFGMFLAQPHPNPFNPVTTINWEIFKSGTVEVAIFDLTGRRVKILVQESLDPGSYSTSWDGTNLAGNLMPSGTYLVGMSRDGEVETRKISLIK